jgi:hypothetical protein
MPITERTAHKLIVFTFVLAWACAMPTYAKGQKPIAVDVELVLAVDVSLSMDMDEQRLQREGYVAAFRDQALHKAIAAGSHTRIAVTYMEWADAQNQSVVIPWTIIDSPAAAMAFADQLAAAPISRARMTSISGALNVATALIEQNNIHGTRRVIDISGDGPNNAGLPVKQLRDEVVARGIVINGLPIMLKSSTRSGFFNVAELDIYYMDCVIGGAGSFVIPIRDRSEFITATRKKLLLEISNLTPLRPSPRPADRPARIMHAQFKIKPGVPQRASKLDCLIGEKLWQDFLKYGSEP